MKTAVVAFPGSNCDADTIRGLQHVTGHAPEVIWHKDTVPTGTELVVLPGGFSYGDYLRAGAIARFSPVMASVKEFANAGGLVLGICNGFQILVEAGLLPGALIKNTNLQFQCRWVHLRRDAASRSPFAAFDQEVLRIPIAHGQGRYYVPASELPELKARGQIAFRYCDADGNIGDETNPNGSVENIAGVTNEAGNVLGMMPHPERALDADLGSTDGRLILSAALGLSAAK